MKTIQLNNSLKAHLLLGVVISIWLVIFLVFIAPFDVSDVAFNDRLGLMPMYGVLFFASYLLGLLFQNFLYIKTNNWNLWKEITTLLITYSIMPVISFPYYKSDWVQGEYDFFTFLLTVYLPIALIYAVLPIFGRIYLNKLKAKKDQSKIVLKGSNKTDILKIEPEDLICISSAQNYVEIHYLLKGTLQKKLLRITLKTIQEHVPDLVQVHRSHLVNPSHFVKWINNNTAQVHDLEISISKKYKDAFSKAI